MSYPAQRTPRITRCIARSRTVLFISVALLISIILSSCAGTALSGPTVSTDNLASSISSAGSASVSINVNTGVPPSFKHARLSGHAAGSYDFSGETGQVSFNGISLPKNSRGTFVFTSNSMYMKMPPAMASGISTGKQWVRLAYSVAAVVPPLQMGFIVAGELLDPGFILEQLKHGAKYLHRSGTANTALGETSYSGTLNLKPLAQKNGCGVGAAPVSSSPFNAGLPTTYSTPPGCIQSTLADIEANYSGSYLAPVTVWINNGRVVKITVELDPASTWGEGNGSGRMPEETTVTMTFSHFGTAVHATVPSSAEIVDLPNAQQNTPYGVQPVTLYP